jgi:hypothetical protein
MQGTIVLLTTIGIHFKVEAIKTMMYRPLALGLTIIVSHPFLKVPVLIIVVVQPFVIQRPVLLVGQLSRALHQVETVQMDLEAPQRALVHGVLVVVVRALETVVSGVVLLVAVVDLVDLGGTSN